MKDARPQHQRECLSSTQEHSDANSAGRRMLTRNETADAGHKLVTFENMIKEGTTKNHVGAVLLNLLVRSVVMTGGTPAETQLLGLVGR